ncbi:MAG TPA: CofH family radical SAM protein [Candidatus Hydrogenedentes bacterium]|nr:CofH family radical SAM protein [Candidatus Hydrogenedentota bacterium]HNT86503.1 CofH family radical SAM protein [Candidatus Hydrogenedentota bacterium]
MSSETEPSAYRLDRGASLDALRNAPLLELGRRAFDRKRALCGDRVTYVRNRHVNPTNLCVYACAFCDFAAKRGDDHAYSLTDDEILAGLADPSIREAHIVGGLWPKWGFDRSTALVRRIRAARPDLHIKAFTAVEVAYFARMEQTDAESVLREMIDAGVDMMPGGGAEVLSARVHRALYPDKIGPDEWIEIHEKAHCLGLPSNATLLFGHIETDEEIVDHLLRLRELEDRAPGFQSFIPLAYLPGTTRLAPRPPGAPRCLRIVALARLVLDNVPHVKAYTPTLGVETAAAALTFGADDLDGTLGHERIMQYAGTAAPAAMSARLMDRMIRQAGQTPVERDGVFDPVANASPALAAT